LADGFSLTLSFFPFFISSLCCRSGGPGLLLGGSVIALKAFGDLGSDSLSPFPSPPKGASLKLDGIYGQMRHPMYTGLLMIMAGLSIATNSADRLLLTALLWFLVDIKASKEEGTCLSLAFTVYILLLYLITHTQTLYIFFNGNVCRLSD
jgi:protein-S-isoprenylcysteine O-methyltransferase Ste14